MTLQEQKIQNDRIRRTPEIGRRGTSARSTFPSREGIAVISEDVVISKVILDIVLVVLRFGLDPAVAVRAGVPL
jgi:hypothetical protein